MPITRERLLERRSALSLDLENLRQQFLAISGAIADVDFWLAQMEPISDPPAEIIPQLSTVEVPKE